MPRYKHLNHVCEKSALGEARNGVNVGVADSYPEVTLDIQRRYTVLATNLPVEDARIVRDALTAAIDEIDDRAKPLTAGDLKPGDKFTGIHGGIATPYTVLSVGVLDAQGVPTGSGLVYFYDTDIDLRMMSVDALVTRSGHGLFHVE